MNARAFMFCVLHSAEVETFFKFFTVQNKNAVFPRFRNDDETLSIVRAETFWGVQTVFLHVFHRNVMLRVHPAAGNRVRGEDPGGAPVLLRCLDGCGLAVFRTKMVRAGHDTIRGLRQVGLRLQTIRMTHSVCPEKWALKRRRHLVMKLPVPLTVHGSVSRIFS